MLSLSYSRKSKSLKTPNSVAASSRLDPPLMSLFPHDISSVLDAMLDCLSMMSEVWLNMTEGLLGRPTRCPQVVNKLTKHSLTRP